MLPILFGLVIIGNRQVNEGTAKNKSQHKSFIHYSRNGVETFPVAFYICQQNHAVCKEFVFPKVDKGVAGSRISAVGVGSTEACLFDSVL